jgi:hypothetical protein
MLVALVVVLQAVSGFFQWRHCGGEKEQATDLVKNMWQTWC